MENGVAVPAAPTRILVVDDFQPFRNQLKAFLQRRPEYLCVGEADNGIDAVQEAECLLPDVILLDIGLPRLSGMHAARQIAECSPASKVIFVTQDANSCVAEAALKGYGWGYVVKADANRELLPAIDTVLKGNKYVSRRFCGCDWAKGLDTIECVSEGAETLQLVRANSALASAHANISKSQALRDTWERLLRERPAVR